VKTVADPDVVTDLVARLRRLRPDSERRWGTLTAPEMLCHLADCSSSVLKGGTRPQARKGRPLLKWVALYAPVPWPKGKIRTRPEVDPQAKGTRPLDFEQDRARAIDGVQQLGAAPADTFPPSHFMFGPMGAGDWRRWGYLHTDHHLRQFGL
jgi:hypothetical protein